MIPLVITEVERERIRAMKEYAEANRLDLQNMLARSLHPGPFEDLAHREIEIPFGFRAVYSIEQQPEPLDWCHHFSFSLNVPGRSWNPVAVEIFIKEFGITFPGWGHVIVQVEQTSPRKPVHVLIPLVPFSDKTGTVTTV